MTGLRFFQRTSNPHTFLLASYHDPLSLTWSWGLSFHRFTADERRWRPLFMTGHPHGQQRWALRLPPFGILSWLTQKKMPRPQ